MKDLEARIKIIGNKLSENSKKNKESLEKDLKTAKSKTKELKHETVQNYRKNQGTIEKELKKIESIVEGME